MYNEGELRYFIRDEDEYLRLARWVEELHCSKRTEEEQVEYEELSALLAEYEARAYSFDLWEWVSGVWYVVVSCAGLMGQVLGSLFRWENVVRR